MSFWFMIHLLQILHGEKFFTLAALLLCCLVLRKKEPYFFLKAWPVLKKKKFTQK